MSKEFSNRLRRGQLIVIGGPTASGKTGFAIKLARRIGCSIVSADSRQFYRELPVGSAQPTEEELAAIRHYLVADRSVTEPLSAGRYAEEAKQLLRQLFLKNKIQIITGGSGLFISALTEGLDDFPPVTSAAETQVGNWFAEGGAGRLFEELQQRDPDYAATVDPTNHRRLERALRVTLSAGRPYSSFLGQREAPDFDVHYFRLDPPRAELYGRINRRVDTMLAAGLEDEARGLQHLRHLRSLQTVGYQEWWPYFDGEYDRDRAVELIKRNSRRYAKRQVTWFGRGDKYRTVSSPEDVLAYLTALPEGGAAE